MKRLITSKEKKQDKVTENNNYYEKMLDEGEPALEYFDNAYRIDIKPANQISEIENECKKLFEQQFSKKEQAEIMQEGYNSYSHILCNEGYEHDLWLIIGEYFKLSPEAIYELESYCGNMSGSDIINSFNNDDFIEI